MPRSWVFGSTNAIVLILVGTAVFSMQTPLGKNLIPYGPYLALGLQVGLPLMLAPELHRRLDRRYRTLATCLVLFTLLLLFSLMSGFWSQYPWLVFRRSLMIFVPVILIGLLIWADSEPLVTFIKVSRFIVGFVTVLAAIGILLHFFGTSSQLGNVRVEMVALGPIILAQRIFGKAPFIRVSSLFGNPNLFALWLLLGIVLTVLLIHLKRINNIRGFVYLLIQFVALAFTFSRAGIASTFAALIVYCYLTFGHNRKVKWVLSALVITGIVACGVFLIGAVHPSSIRFSLDLNGRDVAWNLLAQAVTERPLLGVGFGVSYEAILKPHGLEISAHNAHLQTLAEIGFAGYSLVILTWLYPVLNCWRKLRQREKEQQLVLAASISILLALFVHQVFESVILRYGFHTLFWGYLLFTVAHPRVTGGISEATSNDVTPLGAGSDA